MKSRYDWNLYVMIFALIPKSKSNQDNDGGYAVNITVVGLVKHTTVREKETLLSGSQVTDSGNRLDAMCIVKIQLSKMGHKENVHD